MRSLILSVVVCMFGNVAMAGHSSCAGPRWTPVRNVVAGVHHRVHCAIENRRARVAARSSCSAVQAAPSCSHGLGATIGDAPQAPPQPQAAIQSNGGGLAQQKAMQQASEGRMRHVGGSFGPGRYEGVGFSTRSPDDAIRACCYWGERTPVDIGVARGQNGYYATVLYR